MPQTILTGNTLAAGLRSDFQETYRPIYDGVEKELGSVMALDIPTQHLTETFAYRESLPGPALWLRGDPMPEGGLGSKSYTVTHFDYARRVTWHRNDRHDNRIGDLYADARMLGGRFARLDSKAFIEILTGTASLLPAIPTCPDGAALFATTAGGVNRFGVSSGNLLTGTGVATAAAIMTDFYSAITQFDKFQDTTGEPYYEPDAMGASYVVYFGVGNRKLFSDAFKLNLVHSVISSTGAAISNTILADGINVRLVATSRITDNDWFVFREDAPVKAIASTLLEPLREEEATADNSDVSRDSGLEYVQFVVRKGYLCNIPIGAIKVNN